MKAKLRESCGVYGIPMYDPGQEVEVEPFIGPYGDVCPDLFKLVPDGLVVPAKLIELVN